MGGRTQQERMIRDKRRSLDKAVLYSYQGAFVKKFFPLEEEVTEELRNKPPVRALINPDKIKQDYDDKIISIPYKDICLNSGHIYGKTHEGEEEIGMKVGDTFT